MINAILISHVVPISFKNILQYKSLFQTFSTTQTDFTDFFQTDEKIEKPFSKLTGNGRYCFSVDCIDYLNSVYCSIAAACYPILCSKCFFFYISSVGTR